MIVWSYGGGTQSIAILLLVLAGNLPRPDLIIMADTSREARRTWRYNEQYVFPKMVEAGLNFQIAPHDLATVDLYGKNGDLLIPAYTKGGKLPTFCSNEWKTRVVRRYLKSLYGKDFKCIMWLGMSIDEVERLKPSGIGWIENHWPLCGMPASAGYSVSMTRHDCEQLILASGMPTSPKSACNICPHTTNPVWLDMKVNDPEDFAESVVLDHVIRVEDIKRGGTGLYLHRSAKPLDEVDFTEPEEETLFGCDSGFCWT